MRKLILKFVTHIDLFRIKGVGEAYADLLEEAGVDTVPAAHTFPCRGLGRGGQRTAPRDTY